MSHQQPTRPDMDLRHRIGLEATHALLDHPNQLELKGLAVYDLLRMAMPGWRVESMMDLTNLAKRPFAWFLLRHEERGWWAAHWVSVPCLSHPFPDKYVHTDLVHPGDLVVGETENLFLDSVHATATTPRFGAGQMEDPTTIDIIHAQWVLGHFETEQAKAYQMLLAFTPAATITR